MLPRVVQRLLAPAIMVCATPDAEQACGRNLLSFSDLLRPHAQIEKDVYVRTPRDQAEALVLRSFYVRFVDALELQKPTVDQLDTFFTDIVQGALDSSSVSAEFPRIRDRADTPQIQKLMMEGRLTPWFDRYVEEFISSFRAQDHECFDHPVACILAVSSSHPDPVAALRALYNPDDPPVSFGPNAIDPNVYRYYVVVHDRTEGPGDDKASAALSKVREAFGAHDCRLLAINSIPASEVAAAAAAIAAGEPSPRRQPDIWTPVIPARKACFRADAAHGPQYSGPFRAPLSGIGACLTPEDVISVGQLVEEIVLRGFLPAAERKMRSINDLIAASRKGIRNRMANWLKSKREPGSDMIDLPNGQNRFLWPAPEIQIRRLGDLAFMLRDYDFALQQYKQLHSDFRGEKTLKYFAGVQEMAGLCTLMMGGSKKDAELYLDTAHQEYIRANETALALRPLLFIGDLLKTKGDHRRAAETYLRASAIDDNNNSAYLRCALLMEQASVHLLAAPQPLVRRAALYIVLAGHRYSVSRQVKHSLRCYQLALNVFLGRNWTQVDEHLYLALGRLTTFLGDVDRSVSHMHMFMTVCRHQSSEKQSSHLREFVNVVKAFCADDVEREVPELSLPTIVDTGIRVLSSEFGRPSYTDEGQADSVWREMQDTTLLMVSSAKKANERALAGGEEAGQEKSKSSSIYSLPSSASFVTSAASAAAAANKRTSCVVGESIYVEVELKNPLSIPLDLSDMILVASFTEAPLIAPPVSSLEQDGQDSPSSGAGLPQQPPFIADSLSTIIGPKERRTIHLAIRPTRPGELKITGVRWTLAGSIRGRKSFALRGKRLLKTKQQRAGRFYEPDHRLTIKCLPSMPSLAVSLSDNSPHNLWHGEVVRCLLQLKNNGPKAASNLYLRLSHPSFVSLDGDEVGKQRFENENGAPSSSFASASANSITTITPASSYSDDLSLYALPIQDLQPGASISIPLFLRASKPGEHEMHWLLYYENDSSSSSSSPSSVSPVSAASSLAAEYRFHRLMWSMSVQPTLSIKTSAQPSARHPGSLIMTIQMRNLREIQKLSLSHMAFHSAMWTVSPLTGTSFSSPNGVVLDAGESISLHYRVSRRAVDADSEVLKRIQKQGRAVVEHSIVSLFPSSAADQSPASSVPASSSSPFVDFLLRECAFSPKDRPESPIIAMSSQQRSKVLTKESLCPLPASESDTPEAIATYAALLSSPLSLRASYLGAARCPFAFGADVALSLLWRFIPDSSAASVSIASPLSPSLLAHLSSSSAASSSSVSMNSRLGWLSLVSVPLLPSTHTSLRPYASPITASSPMSSSPNTLPVPLPPLGSASLPSAMPASVAAAPAASSSSSLPPHLQQYQMQTDPQCPLSYVLSHPSTVYHSFSSPDSSPSAPSSACAPCSIPVRFHLSNFSRSRAITITIETFSRSPSSAPSSLPTSSLISWTGLSRVTVERIEPLQHAELDAFIQVWHPGIYNVNSFRFHWSYVESPKQVDEAGNAVVSPLAVSIEKKPLSKVQLAAVIEKELLASKFVRDTQIRLVSERILPSLPSPASSSLPGIASSTGSFASSLHAVVSNSSSSSSSGSGPSSGVMNPSASQHLIHVQDRP